MNWIWGVVIFITVILLIRTKKRGYFWKDKSGKEIGANEFRKRFWQGVEGITPLQQTLTTLWSTIPIFGGLGWGIVISIMGGTYWLAVILVFTFPITGMGFIGGLQKYRRLKAIKETMDEAMGVVKEKKQPKKLKDLFKKKKIKKAKSKGIRR